MNTVPEYPIKTLRRSAADTVTLLARGARAAEHTMRQSGKWDDFQNLLRDGLFLPGREMLLPAELLSPSAFLATHNYWERRPVVCSMHPLIVTELHKMSPSTMPTELLRHMAYDNPLIVWPVPVPVITLNAPQGELIAAWVTGIVSSPESGRRGLCLGSDPERIGFRLMIVCRHQAGLEQMSIELPTTAEEFDPVEIVAQTVRAYARHDAAQGITRDGGEDHYIESAISKITPVLEAMIFLCTRDLDVRETHVRETGEDRRARYRRSPGAPDPRMFELGYRWGPDITTERRAYEQAQSTGGGFGGTFVPHPVRCFYQRHWSGPGRAVPVQRFHRPVFRRPQKGGPTVPTIASVG